MPNATFTPYQLTVGTVVGAFQSTNSYDVITDFGRYRGWYFEGSAGGGGVRSGGGIAAGSQILIAFKPGEQEAWIVTVLQPPWQAGPSEPSQLSVYPQVSGFAFDPSLPPEKQGNPLGQLYRMQRGVMANRPSDVLSDLVNGEWGVASPYGPGVGIELFRSFVRGGPAAGLWCWGGTQPKTRLMGLDFEFMTMAQEDSDLRQGNSLVRVRRRVLYPKEAANADLPRDLEVYGAIHGGEHRFLAPIEAVGASQTGDSTPKARQALLHEFRGLDGSYVLSSASLICLERTVAVQVPDQAPAPAAGTDAAAQAATKADADRNAALQAPREPVTTQENTPLAWVQHALDVVQAIRDLGNGGFDRTADWSPRGDQTQTFFSSYGREMWRSLPQVTQVTLDGTQGSRTFYIGRSSFTLMPDGSVVVEDAWHSQIVMAGGNIVFAAAHDLIFSAGRNVITTAGNALSQRANQHIDLSANRGRVSIKAEDQLSLLGGNNGTGGGVLIESKSGKSDIGVGTGLAQTVGGVVIKSATSLWMRGAEVGVASSSDITLKADGNIVTDAGQLVANVSEVLIYADPTAATPSYQLTNNLALVPGILQVNGTIECGSGLFLNGTAIVNGSVESLGTADVKQTEMTAAAKPFLDQMKAANTNAVANTKDTDKALQALLKRKTPLDDATNDKFGFTFATSKQLKTDAAFSFVIPEMRWQTIARRANHGSSQAWVENPVQSRAGDNLSTSAYPGYEAWTQIPNYRYHNADLRFDLTTGLPKLDSDGKPVTDIPAEITDSDTATIDKHFLIGDDV